MLYVLSAKLTGAPTVASDLLDAIAGRLSGLHPLANVATDAAAGLIHFAAEDAVVFANGDKWSESASAAVTAAAEVGALVLPIAIDIEHRHPPQSVEHLQSYDVDDARRRLGSPARWLTRVADDFSRGALARMAPTCLLDRFHVFLSYRRADGEGLTAQLDASLSALHQHVRRDLVDIQTGAASQQRIDELLTEADVLVFLDTPLAGESEWIEWELATALGRGTPIVWVRLGPEEGRIRLPVQPGDHPQLQVGDGVDADSLAAQVMSLALEQTQEAIRSATSAFRRVKAWADTHNGEVRALDQRRLIYSLVVPESATSLHPRRPRHHIVQVFGRVPSEADASALVSWLDDNGYTNHPKDCRAFDAAILIRPAYGLPRAHGDWLMVQTGAQYVAGLDETGVTSSPVRPCLLAFGAFPDVPDSHAVVTAAISDLVRGWLQLGGNVAFGAHPTFTPLVSEAARAVLPDGSHGRVTIFHSQYFPDPVPRYVAGHVILVPVAAEATRDASLSAMRARMVSESNAAVAVLIGGRTAEGGLHTPGLDEELALAVGAGIPVVCLGATGGQAGVIADREAVGDPPWAGLGNGLTSEENLALAESDDFDAVVQQLWARFGPP